VNLGGANYTPRKYGVYHESASIGTFFMRFEIIATLAIDMTLVYWQWSDYVSWEWFVDTQYQGTSL
jgi:hypothetical protein